MGSSAFIIDLEIARGIERWENEGGRIPVVAKALSDSNHETESVYLVLNNKRFVALMADAHELQHETFR
jgi:hypothetical protein